VLPDLGIPLLDRPGKVPGGDARIGAPEPTSGRHDAVRVSHPTRVQGPQIVRRDIPQTHGGDSTAEAAAKPAVALLASHGVLLPSRKDEYLRTIRDRREVAAHGLDDECRDQQVLTWASQAW